MSEDVARPVDRAESLLGRKEERRRLAEWLERRPGLVTVWGPPGVGKTRLARQVARDLSDQFDAGPFFADLTALSTPAEALVAGAQALGASSVDEVPEFLTGAGRALLVIDNAEHLLADELIDTFGRWVEAAELRVLVTSRRRLGAAFERELALEGLPADRAVELFERRAKAQRAGLEVDRDVAARLVARLDYLPLAIELAAGRTRIATPAQILERLDERFELLRTRASHGEPRHATLHGAIEASWQALGEVEQAALAHCSAFRSPFTLDAAAAVLRPESDARLIDILESLVDSSLLQLDEERGGAPRFRMLESIAEFATARLDDRADAADIARQHEAWVVDFWNRWRADRHGPGDRRWTREVRSMLPEAVAAHRRAAEEDAERRARLACIVAELHFAHGTIGLAADAVDAALQTAEDISDEVRGLLLQRQAFIDIQRGDLSASRRASLRGLEFARAAGAELLVGQLSGMLAYLESVSGNIEAALARQQDTVAAFVQVGQVYEIATAVGELGRMLHDVGRLDEARRALQRANRLVQECSNPVLEARLAALYGSLLEEMGEYEAGREQFERALALAEAEPFLDGAHWHAWLAALLQSAGDLQEARSHYERAIEAFRQSDRVDLVPNCLLDLGILYLEQEAFVAAQESLLNCHETARADEYMSGFSTEAAALGVLAASLAGAGRVEAAGQRMQEATERLEEHASGTERDRLERLFEVCEALVDAYQGRESGSARRLAEAALEADLKQLRWLGRVLAARFDAAGASRPGAASRPVLRLHREGRWFSLPDAEEPTDISRRGAIRRIIAALGRAHADGRALGVYELLDVGWPGEVVEAESGATRVYTTLSRMRDLGFDAYLVTTDEGYQLSPKLEVCFSDAEL